MAPVRVKICGLRSAADVEAASQAGAAYVGFVFFPGSPRHVTPLVARDAALAAPVGVAKVALTVDADDMTLDEIVRVVPLDMLQLHGHESPERVSEIRARYGLPVMKVIGVASTADFAEVDRYASVADQLLIETKPALGALPGGNGVPFDWSLLTGRRWPLPWMLAGGLNLTNIAAAIRISGAQQVDLSSGVESAPGIKDYGKIAAFMAAVKGER